MIARYTRPAMGRIWSDENKYRAWLTVEVAASQALARFGLVGELVVEGHRNLPQAGWFRLALMEFIPTRERRQRRPTIAAAREIIEAVRGHRSGMQP